MKKCKTLGIKPHPARFPRDFADFFIKFATNEGDVVLDPFAGSNTTGFAAEELKRKWIAMEINEPYLENSKIRFEDKNDLFQTKYLLNGATQEI